MFASARHADFHKIHFEKSLFASNRSHEIWQSSCFVVSGASILIPEKRIKLFFKHIFLKISQSNIALMPVLKNEEKIIIFCEPP